MTQPLFVPGPLLLPDSTDASPLVKFIQNDVRPAWQREKARLKIIQGWMDGSQPVDYKVQGREDEKRVLLRLAKAPWLSLATSMFSQALYVDGYRGQNKRENADIWDTWVLNNFEAQQIAIHRHVVGLGYCYARALPGVGPDGSDKAFLRAVSPTRGYALFEDPVTDPHPKWFLEFLPDNHTLRWYDGETYRDFVPDDDKGLRMVDEVEHFAGVTPVVRYTNAVSLDGEPQGDIEPVISLAAKIDKTAYDRLLSQHFNSWRVRWATGVEQGETPEEEDEDLEKLQNNSILSAENPAARFGTLDQTSLEGFITAQEADVKDLFTVLQLPADIAGGQIINVGPDALAAARKGFSQKVFEKQRSIGITHSRLLRLAAVIEGDLEQGADYRARVHWQDPDIRSLAQAADAWGKIVTMLKVPAWAAWSHLPDVDPEEVDLWYEHLLDSDPRATYLRDIVKKPEEAQQAQRGASSAGAERKTPKAA